MFASFRTKRLVLVSFFLTVILLCSACEATAPTEKQNTVKVDPEQIQKMEMINQIADDMYKLTMEGQVEEARNKLLQLSDQITKIRFDGITTVEGLNALTETITEAKRVYNAVSYSQEEGQVAVAKIRLATDALTHVNQPMWLQYYKALQNDVSVLEQAVTGANLEGAKAAFGKLTQHISIIHPSIQISRQPSDVEKLDSLLLFIRNGLNSTPVASNQVLSGIEQLQKVLDELFMKNSQATAYLPIADPKQPILWSIGIGFIIVTVLTYAGWRMYQTGRGIVPANEKKQG